MKNINSIIENLMREDSEIKKQAIKEMRDYCSEDYTAYIKQFPINDASLTLLITACENNDEKVKTVANLALLRIADTVVDRHVMRQSVATFIAWAASDKRYNQFPYHQGEMGLYCLMKVAKGMHRDALQETDIVSRLPTLIASVSYLRRNIAIEMLLNLVLFETKDRKAVMHVFLNPEVQTVFNGIRHSASDDIAKGLIKQIDENVKSEPCCAPNSNLVSSATQAIERLPQAVEVSHLMRGMQTRSQKG